MATVGNDRRRGPRPTTAAAALVGVAALAIAVLVLALRAGGGAPPAALPGLPDPGRLVGWGVPIFRTIADLCLIAAVGTALLALLLPLEAASRAPRRSGGQGSGGHGSRGKGSRGKGSRGKGSRGKEAGNRLSGDARRMMRGAAVAAGCASVAFAGTALLAFADEVGDLRRAISPAVLRADLPGDSSSTDLLLTAAVLATAALAGGWAASRGGRDAGSVPLLLTFAAVLPIAVTGHSAEGSAHAVAMASLGVHLLAVCTWVGGLGALTGYALHRGRALALVVPRFSTVAAACYAAVGVSGVVNSAARMSRAAQFVTTDYGRLVTCKAIAFGLLGLLALGQRRRVLPVLAATIRAGAAGPAATVGVGTAATRSADPVDAARRAFARLAGTEVVLMAATVGLAVALSRTPTPGG